MDVSMPSASAPVSWKTVAVQRQEVLRTGGEGEFVKEARETIQPTLYTAKDGRVEVQQLASSSTLNLLV
ncbi:hypothetical protein [uncultured Mediterranean phage uvMED]|nr:hypothetical protein [uncultured Mediterranean phage uvMED]BAR19654.1 hypothetical protein [uncultured Mediterranean phage uvMED]